ncbi:MAG: hypothetical protein QOI80_1098 [Solirubrobacteraceae bacterium]|nr:hypothetical protein [Solirubrobacteraceae bacterium]
MRSRVILLLSVAAALAVPGFATGASSGTVLHAKLTGKAEAPGPGDTDGRAKVKITLKKSAGKVCWRFRGIRNISEPAAAHIHAGAKGVPGPVTVPLGGAFAKKGCTPADKSVIATIAAHPRRFYVNIHTSDFPDGAIRGQLK